MLSIHRTLWNRSCPSLQVMTLAGKERWEPLERPGEQAMTPAASLSLEARFQSRASHDISCKSVAKDGCSNS